MKILLRDIIKATKGQLILGDPMVSAEGFCVDSRLVKPGEIFFALSGQNKDGHGFVQEVFRKGASAVIVSQLDWLAKDSKGITNVIQVKSPLEALQKTANFIRSQFLGPVVGITGSNGKTTTKQMLGSILAKNNPGLLTQGNYNSQIGLPIVLSHLLPEHQWIVLEMGASSKGNIAALCEMGQPKVGIITSIGPAHLETFGSIQGIAAAKWELIDSLPVDGCAVLPWGEAHLDPFIRSYKNKIIFFGEDSSCAVKASSIETGEQISFMLHLGSRSYPITLPLSGRFNVKNAMAAAAAAWALNTPVEKIVEGLTSFQAPPMRMQVLSHSSGAVIINDAYNANPASMAESIKSLMESYPNKKKYLIVGSMLELGVDSERFHFHLGNELGRMNLEKIFLVGELTNKVFEGAESVGSLNGKFYQGKTFSDIAELLTRDLDSNSVVLLKGSRSNKLEKIIDYLMSPTEIKGNK
ncbi:MAG: UDP-N-acetylmuramoyl-tripeptide--D-alanyl-D-alanine ligase [Elusimicrobiota bacterium]